MRIENNLKPKVGTVPTDKVSVQPKTAFSTMMSQANEKMHREALQQLIANIDQTGKRLTEQMTLSHLKEYKKLVKQFMGELINNGLQLKEHRPFSQRGNGRTQKIVEEVDQKLVQLANEMLQQEKNQLQILALVGDIKGLLVNLYS